MTAAKRVIAAEIVVLLMVDAQMEYAASAGRDLLIVRLVCSKSASVSRQLDVYE